MQRKNWVSFGFIAALLVASVLILNASTPKKAEPVCCKTDLKKCSETETRTPKETPVENLSHQFIALPGIFH
jgi:hypothetical protein